MRKRKVQLFRSFGHRRPSRHLRLGPPHRLVGEDPCWSTLWFVLLGLSVAFTSGCFFQGRATSNDEDKKEQDRVPVEVTTIRRGPIESVLRASRHLEAEASVKVFSRASNLVLELLVEEGDEVTSDQLLLQLEDDVQRTQLAKTQSQVERARQEFERQKALHAEQLISDQAFAEAQFELRQLELSLEDAERQLAYTEVRAPIAGTVTRRLVNRGDHVTANQHLFDIVDFNSIVARVHVPERDFPQLEPGSAARISSSAFPSRTFAGIVRRIAPVVDEKTGTVKVTVGLPEIGPLRPGMYVDVELVMTTEADALLIPNEALVYDGGQRFVYRLLPDRTVERVLVETDLSDGLHVKPAGGFSEGDEIVIAGKAGLKDGAKVRLAGDPLPSEKAKEKS